MKVCFKKFAIFFLVLNILCLCACKNTVDPEVVVSDTASKTTQTQPTDTTPEQILDPENNEIGRDTGKEINFTKPQNAQAVSHGIDVSKWQGNIDWQKLKNAGIDFAIIRIGFRGENGVIYRDDNADYNIQQAQKHGVLVGVYFFSTAISTAESLEEAAWTTNAIKGYKISYPVVFDCEGYTNTDSRMYTLSAQERTDNALAFLNHIKNAGYDTMIYGAKSDFEDTAYWEISRIESDYKVWIAHYPENTYPQKQNPDYSGRYDMWQYTNRGTVDGVDGNCDMVVSYFKATESTPKDAAATPDQAEPPKTQQELIYTDIEDLVTAKDEVNLREGAGTKFNVVATLKSGEFLTRTGIGFNGWSRLIYNGQTVYAISSYLSNEIIEVQKSDVVNGITFNPCSDSVTAKMEVNLRALPTTDSEIIAKLTSGTFLPRKAKSDNGWSRLDYNGTVVYAVTNYLTTEAPEIIPPEISAETTTITEYDMIFTLITVNVTAKEEVNLRNMPTTDGSAVVYTLKKGEYITKTGVSDSGWARLEYNGQTVYCIDSFLMQ